MKVVDANRVTSHNRFLDEEILKPMFISQPTLDNGYVSFLEVDLSEFAPENTEGMTTTIVFDLIHRIDFDSDN